MFIEMAYSLCPDAPIFPGLPHDEFIPHTRMSEGGESNTTMVKHFLHNGTHVDAPFHFYDKGKTIDQIPIEDFCYTKPLVVQKMLPKGGLLQPEDIKACGPSLYEADILLLCTGYHALRLDRDVYMDDFPSLSVEAAKLIRTELLNVKAVAIDTLSIESCRLGPQQNFPVHKTMLDSEIYQTRTVLIFEDVNMGQILTHQITRIYAFPLRLTGLDASPVSIVAEVL
jgi:kynurenine formamidase